MFSIRRLSAAALALAALAVSGLLPAASGATSTAPRVSVISDSILTAVTWSNDQAQAALSQGLDLQIDAGVGRRLNGQSVEFNGSYVPTTLSVIGDWSNRLGSIVVIVDGYNDLPGQFAGDVELTLDTLRNDGVQHVLWVNLHEVQPEYVAKNAVLAAAARKHPELRVLDWNAYSAGHPEWYQTDFVHLRPAGGLAIASWLQQAIADTVAPPTALAPAPAPKLVARAQRLVARVGVRFDRHLRASGGAGGLHWRTTNAALRNTGLHLLARGELKGRPRHAKRFALPLVVTDAGGSTATITVTLTVRPDGRAAPHRRP